MEPVSYTHLDVYKRQDMAYMEQLTGKTGEELADELRGVIFRVPSQTEPDGTPHYVTADEYLSLIHIYTTDLDAYDGIFAVTREEWEESPTFDAQVKELSLIHI